MLGRLIEKELLHRLLDFRFIAVFAICAGLAALSVFTGVENFVQDRAEYATASTRYRTDLETVVREADFENLTRKGMVWLREPKPLSPIVYGLTGTLGSEARVKYWAQFLNLPLVHFEASPFEANPAIAMFGVLDLAFVVKIVMSLVALLFTYDAVSGEKENGTLRLYASFPVSRAAIALSKVIGCSLSILIPFAFAFLLAAVVLVFSADVGLEADDWLRMAAMMGTFGLYLTVFVAFGLWASALTHRRTTAFLGLLAVWAVMVFVIPNAAVRIAEIAEPVENVYSLDRARNRLRWETGRQMHADRNDFWRENFRQYMDDGESTSLQWDDMHFTQQAHFAYGNRFIDPERKTRAKWRAAYHSQMTQMQEERRNHVHAQQRLATTLSAISPVSAVTIATVDLAGNGLVQQEKVEKALGTYQDIFIRYIWEKDAQFRGAFGWYDGKEKAVLTDFVPFVYQDDDTVSAILARNVFQILNLVLLSLLGFAGAYVAILRYDVR